AKTNGDVGNQLYIDGQKSTLTGEHTNGKYYVNGILANGLQENGLHYTNGAKTNGLLEDGLHYTNGEKTNGDVGNQLYIDGQKSTLTGEHTNGKYYVNGILANGLQKNGLHYTNGTPTSGLVEEYSRTDNGSTVTVNVGYRGGKKVYEEKVRRDSWGHTSYVEKSKYDPDTGRQTNYYRWDPDEIGGGKIVGSDFSW
ncbi:hypothetical protein J6Q66_03575, partial [bacterium]|nr:hypothetical protein [bacterium]